MISREVTIFFYDLIAVALFLRTVAIAEVAQRHCRSTGAGGMEAAVDPAIEDLLGIGESRLRPLDPMLRTVAEAEVDRLFEQHLSGFVEAVVERGGRGGHDTIDFHRRIRREAVQTVTAHAFVGRRRGVGPQPAVVAAMERLETWDLGEGLGVADRGVEAGLAFARAACDAAEGTAAAGGAASAFGRQTGAATRLPGPMQQQSTTLRVARRWDEAAGAGVVGIVSRSDTASEIGRFFSGEAGGELAAAVAERAFGEDVRARRIVDDAMASIRAHATRLMGDLARRGQHASPAAIRASTEQMLRQQALKGTWARVAEGAGKIGCGLPIFVDTHAIDGDLDDRAAPMRRAMRRVGW